MVFNVVNDFLLCNLQWFVLFRYDSLYLLVDDQTLKTALKKDLFNDIPE